MARFLSLVLLAGCAGPARTSPTGAAGARSAASPPARPAPRPSRSTPAPSRSKAPSPSSTSPPRYWAEKSEALALDDLDEADEDTLNRIVWHATRGWDTPYPERFAIAETRE
jgi:hypothetical protein